MKTIEEIKSVLRDAHPVIRPIVALNMVLNVVFAFTVPIVTPMIFLLMDTQEAAMAKQISVLGATIVTIVIGIYIASDWFKVWIRRNFVMILWLDAIVYIALNCLAEDMPAARIIGLEINTALLSVMVRTIVNDMINVFTRQDKIVSIQGVSSSLTSFGGLIGGIIGMVMLTSIHVTIDLVLNIQSIAIILDNMAWTLIWRKYSAEYIATVETFKEKD